LKSAADIVEAYARHLQGLATIADIACDGVGRIDLLAIDPVRPARRFHIELSVSLASDAAQTLRTRRAFDDFVTNRFNPGPVTKKLRQYGFEKDAYQKVAVILNPPPAVKTAATDAGVELWNFRSLVQQLVKRFKQDADIYAADAEGPYLKPFGEPPSARAKLSVSQLWTSKDETAWEAREGEVHDAGVNPDEAGLRARLARMSAAEFYDFLRDRYFLSRFVAPSQGAAAVKALTRHLAEGSMAQVEMARQRLVNRVYDSKAEAIAMLMGKHGGIHGLTVAGSSGLLALLYPEEFAPVDAAVAKALRQVGVFESDKPNLKDMSLADAERMIEILRTKALELNRAFGVNHWTPLRVARALTAKAR
jgi:hypothetical protein